MLIPLLFRLRLTTSCCFRTQGDTSFAYKCFAIFCIRTIAQAKGSTLCLFRHPPLKGANEAGARALAEFLTGRPPRHLQFNILQGASPGSSGSPCFDKGWNLVALHHAGSGHKGEGMVVAAIPSRLDLISIFEQALWVLRLPGRIARRSVFLHLFGSALD